MSEGKPGILLVLDGWGDAPPGEGNAIAAAETPCLDKLRATCPTLLVEASGSAVGLLPNTVGNSEIGHMVIGAGRPVPYDSVLVQQQIESGELRANPLLRKAVSALTETGAALHLVGLCSDGAIHADVGHMREFLVAAAELRLTRVWIHAITDERDVSDGTAATYLDRLDEYAAEAGVGRVASVVGRGYAMDKSGDLELTRVAGELIADGVGNPVAVGKAALASADRGDEWVPASAVVGDGGAALGRVQAGDVVLFTNFRSDRIQQLADFLVTRLVSRDVTVLSLAQYDTRAEIPPLVGRADTSGGLGEELARRGLRSVRVAEAEKFEHVTYYINGRDSTVRDIEDHVRITGDGPPDYRARPEMNLDQVVAAVSAASRRDEVALVVANLANIDVVGHTGDLAATVRATEHTDRAVERICSVAQETGRWVLLVGDHGNAERMLKPGVDGRQRPYGGHTTNPVPVVLLPAPGQIVDPTPAGDVHSLADIAPTILALLGHPAGDAMTGRPLW
ncbi:MAG: 2,3-bisphosphoglycerate-independent phosphoglycerate mutase [Kibdelosporangium sp.]